MPCVLILEYKKQTKKANWTLCYTHVNIPNANIYYFAAMNTYSQKTE